MKQRHEWMDVLRGIAIVLVIFNHAVLFTVDTVDRAPGALVLVNDIFAPVRMPLMVFLSGLLLERSLAKGTARHISGKVRAVLYPLGVWTLLILTYDIAADAARGRPLLWPTLAGLVTNPPGHVWFLQYLFVFYLLAIPLRRVPPWIITLIGTVSAIVLPDAWGRFFVLLTFFWLGYAIASYRTVLEKATTSRAALTASGASWIGLALLAVTDTELRYNGWAVPLVAAATILAVAAGGWFARTRASEPFKTIGQQSLVYYLGHWYPTLAAVLIVHRLAPERPYLMVASALLVGLGGAAVLSWAHDRWKPVRLLFALPQPRHERVRAA